MNLFNKSYSLLLLASLTIATVSCNDTTDTLGISLTDDADVVYVASKEFNVSSNSVAANNVVSRSRTGYLGRIKDIETGNYITCNYMTQFRAMGKMQFPSIDSIYINPEDYDQNIAKYKQIKADSCSLIIYISNALGDSLALMKISANELETPYEENITYASDFNPEDEGMIRTGIGNVHSQMAYTTSNRVYSDSQRSSSKFSNRISISLNDPYIDKDGNEYDNYGTYLMRNFYDPAHRESYLNTYKFIHDICPGFYIKNEGGIGNIASTILSQIIVYFTGVIDDEGTTVNLYSSFAGTEEILQKTTILQNTETLNSLLNDNSCTYIKSPAGIFTELTLPVEDIMSGHENDTVNTARLFLPRVNTSEYNDEYTLAIPGTILMVPTDSVASFFDNMKVADFRQSYIATYSSSTNGYTFGNISLLISKMNEIKKKAEAAGETLSPNWNKVTLIPVETSYSTVSTTASVLTKVTHTMAFNSTKLKKGETDSDNIKISVIYSKYKE